MCFGTVTINTECEMVARSSLHISAFPLKTNKKNPTLKNKQTVTVTVHGNCKLTIFKSKPAKFPFAGLFR